jgi:hypothetical protein
MYFYQGGTVLKSLRTLSNNDLLNQLNKLVKREHELSLEILPHLLEVEARGLHLKAGYPSLFKYCVDSLGFSESTAVRRIRAARCARDFPDVYRLLKKREIKIVDAAKIKSVITADNQIELLSGIAGKSQREVDEIVALYGQPVQIRETVRVVKVARPIESPGFVYGSPEAV